MEEKPHAGLFEYPLGVRIPTESSNILTMTSLSTSLADDNVPLSSWQTEHIRLYHKHGGVGIATGYGLDDLGSEFGSRKDQEFSLLM
jgi:hypothetical protein